MQWTQAANRFKELKVPFHLKLASSFLLSSTWLRLASKIVTFEVQLPSSTSTEPSSLLKPSPPVLQNKASAIELAFSEAMDRFLQQHPEALPLAKSAPHPVGAEIVVDILALHPDGQGLSIMDGWIYFTPFVLVGEKVLILVLESTGVGHSKGRLIRILEPSSERREAPCPYFTTCNSCQYQHMPYPRQLSHKQQVVHDLYRPLLPSETNGEKEENNILAPILGLASAEYGYRSKMTPHFKRPDRRKPAQEHAIGYDDVDHRLMDISECALVAPVLNKRYQSLRTQVKSNLGQYANGATLLLRRSLLKEPSSYEALTDFRALAVEKVAHLNLSFIAGSFFQVNIPMLVQALNTIQHFLSTLQGLYYLVDVYCGVGTFALGLSRSFRRVFGIEVDSQCVQLAIQNAKSNGVPHAKFLKGEAQTLFSQMDLVSTCPRESTVVILDPPRLGCSSSFLEQLLAYGPRVIFYMSCFPWTQRVDVAYLIEKGGYRMRLVQPLDFFPQTSHIESLIVLVRE